MCRLVDYRGLRMSYCFAPFDLSTQATGARGFVPRLVALHATGSRLRPRFPLADLCDHPMLVNSLEEVLVEALGANVTCHGGGFRPMPRPRCHSAASGSCGAAAAAACGSPSPRWHLAKLG